MANVQSLLNQLRQEIASKEWYDQALKDTESEVAEARREDWQTKKMHNDARYREHLQYVVNKQEEADSYLHQSALISSGIYHLVKELSSVYIDVPEQMKEASHLIGRFDERQLQLFLGKQQNFAEQLHLALKNFAEQLHLAPIPNIKRVRKASSQDQRQKINGFRDWDNYISALQQDQPFKEIPDPRTLASKAVEKATYDAFFRLRHEFTNALSSVKDAYLLIKFYESELLVLQKVGPGTPGYYSETKPKMDICKIGIARLQDFIDKSVELVNPDQVNLQVDSEKIRIATFRCPLCNGIGWVICEECRGVGQILNRNGYGCSTCDIRGYTLCKTCAGAGALLQGEGSNFPIGRMRPTPAKVTVQERDRLMKEEERAAYLAKKRRDEERIREQARIQREENEAHALRKREQEQQWRAEGRCEKCGEKLGIFDKLFGRTHCKKHR